MIARESIRIDSYSEVGSYGEIIVNFEYFPRA